MLNKSSECYLLKWLDSIDSRGSSANVLFTDRNRVLYCTVHSFGEEGLNGSTSTLRYGDQFLWFIS